MSTGLAGPNSTAMRSRWELTEWVKFGVYFLFACAAFSFARTHYLTTIQYLDLGKYLNGQERLPYQRRVLPMLLLRALLHIPVPQSLLAHRHGIFANLATIYEFVLDVLSVGVTSWFCMKLHRAAKPDSRFALLVFPVLLFCLCWAYLIHSENNNYYPYDMMSVAFFTVGMYCVYTERYLALLAVTVVGSLNRETTMFLVPLYFLDAAARNGPLTLKTVEWRRLPWGKTVLLGVLWMAVKVVLGHFFRGNDASESFFRFRSNLHYLMPNNWPELLSACGYLLPVIWLLRRRISNHRIAAYVLILPLWLLVMDGYAVIMETRVYGELCPLVAVACVLLLETYADETSPLTAVQP